MIKFVTKTRIKSMHNIVYSSFLLSVILYILLCIWLTPAVANDAYLAKSFIFELDLIKLQFATKILSGNANYVMLFGGSSVTAGHDNAAGQSYPHVIKKVDTCEFDI